MADPWATFRSDPQTSAPVEPPAANDPWAAFRTPGSTSIKPAGDESIMGQPLSLEQQYARPEIRHTSGTFTRGLRAGAIGLRQTGLELKAIAQSIFSDPQSVADTMGIVQQLDETQAKLAPKYNTVEDLIGKGSLGDYLSYLGYNLGEQVPNIASIIASGGFGAYLGRRTAELAAKKIVDEQAARLLTQRFVTRGAKIGAYLGASGLEAGNTAQEQYQATGKINPAVALIAGGTKGLLEEATPLLLARKLGLTESAGSGLFSAIDEGLGKVFGKGVIGRVAKGGLEALGTEATTEGLQEAVDVVARHYVDRNYDMLGPEARSRILNAAVSGGLVGAVFGGLAGPFETQHGSTVPAKKGDLATLFGANGGGQEPPADENGPRAVGSPPITPPALGGTTVTEGPVKIESPPVIPPAGPVGTGGGDVASPPKGITLADLPRKVAEIGNSFNVTDEARAYLSGAIIDMRTAQRLAGRQAPDSEVQKFRQSAQQKLDQAIAAGATKLEGGTIPPTAGTPISPPAAPISPPGTTPPLVPPTGRPQHPVPVPPKADSPDLLKAFPKQGYFFPDQLMAAVRAHVASEGGLDYLPKEVKSHLLNNPLKMADLSELQHRVAQSYEESFAKPGQNYTAKDGTQGFVQEVRLVNNKLKVDYAYKTPDGGTLTESEFHDVPVKDISIIASHEIAKMQRDGIPLLKAGRGGASKLGAMLKRSPPTNRTEMPWDYLDEQVDRINQVSGKKEAVTVFRKGKPVQLKPSKLKEGEIGWFGPSIPVAERNFFERLVRQLIPHEKIVFDMSASPKLLEPNGILPQGFYKAMPGGGLIWTNGLREGYQDTMLHELGHAITKAHFRNAPLATQISLFNSFRDKLLGTKAAPMELIFELNSPRFIQPVAEGVRQGIPTIDRVSSPKFQFWMDWFNFDEWISEQTIRWAYENKGINRDLDKYFDGMVTKFNTMVKDFNAHFKDKQINASPGEVIGGWLHSLYTRRVVGVGPMLANEMFRSVDEGSKANAASLGLDQNMPFERRVFEAPPGDASTKNVEGLTNAGFLTKNQKATTDKYSWWVRGTWNLLQIAEKNLHIAALQSYVERTRQWSISRMQLISRANDRLKEWQGLGKEMGQRLSDFLFAIDSMVYLQPGQNARWPTQAELVALAQQHKLNREAGQLYFKIRDDFLHMLDRVEKAWSQDARNTISDPVALQTRLNEISKEMGIYRSRPYFPHSRFGDFAVQVRDGNGKLQWFQQFQSQRAAQAALDPLRAQFPGMRIVLDKMPNEVKSYRGLPPGMLASLSTKLKLSPQQKDWLDLFMFDLSPANSFAKKFKPRKDIAGYSMDAQRAYASYFMHGAGHIARLEHGAAMTQAISDIRESRKTLPDTAIDEKSKRQAIADWTQRHMDYIFDGKSEWSTLRSAAFQFYLGFALDSAILNLTQVPMVAAPYLTSRFGTVGGLAALTANAREKFNETFLRGKVSQDKMNAISEGIRQGFLDEAQASTLAAVSEGGAMSRMLAGTALQRGIIQMGEWSSYMFQRAEKFNRRVVFGAGYDLAKKNPNAPHIANLVRANTELFQSLLSQGWTPENAKAFLAGRDAVDRSQFEYAKWARPEFMRGKKGVVFTFYQFQQNMLWFMKNSPGGKRALFALLAAAGVSGLPFADDLDALIRWMSERFFGTRFKPSEELRKVVAELTDRPDLVMHGLGRESLGMTWLGEMMGLPIPAVDLSSRLGMGSVVPGVQSFFSEEDPRQSFTDKLGTTTKDVLGATFGIGLNIAQALSSGNFMEFKTWENLLPRTAKNVLKAIDYGSTGAATTATGAKIMKFSLTDTQSRMELAAQFLGFTPSSLRAKWDLIAAQKEAFTYWSSRRQELLYEIDKARMAKDREAIRDAMEAVKSYNHSVPSPQLRLTFAQIKESMKARLKARLNVEQGRAPSGSFRGVARDVKKLYPEATSISPSAGM